MGLLDKFFGTAKGQPYVDAGVALTFKLPRSLNLPNWNDGLPDYTQEEIAAIEHRLSEFQNTANHEVAGEAVPRLRKILAGDALAELARNKLAWAESGIESDDSPIDWKPIASTLLKAWASRLDPMSLLELGNLLAKRGCKEEAKETFQVLLHFPTYAKTLWGQIGNEQREMIEQIVGEAKETLQTLR